jgi:predicted outer membrane repeat protein
MEHESIYKNSSNCYFFSNKVNSEGGAIFMKYESIYSDSSNCLF